MTTFHMRRLIMAVMAAFTFGTFTTKLEAHANLDHSDPKGGSVVTSPPSNVKIFFTEDVNGTLSKIEVFDAKGKKVDKGDVELFAGKSILTVSVPRLSPGTYKVMWNAVAADDGHHTEGSFTFEVK